jgi:surface polysaccharide O-acyltransferase-like enzyme
MSSQISPVSDSGLLCQAQTVPHSLPLSVERLASIDRLRILAAIGIVWFHTDGAPHRQIGYAGLPVFLLIFVSLLTTRGSAGTIRGFLRRRYDRLLKPWLFWSAIYGLCRLTKAACAMDIAALREMVSVETLTAGTSIHLWYLPYAFLLSVLIYEFNRWTARANHVVVTSTAVLAGVAFLAVHAVGIWGHELPRPLPQWEFGLAAIPLGIAMGRCLEISPRELQRLSLLMISLAIVIGCQILNSRGFDSAVVPYGIGVSLVCIAYSWEIRSDILVSSLAPLTFGVYLIHPLVAYGLQQILTPDGSYSLFVLLTVCISALVVLALKRTPIRQFL